MKHYTCDNCKRVVSEPEVILKGVVGTSGGILLPERLHEKHFCLTTCFWRWVDRYHPEPKDLSGGESESTGR